MIMKKILMSRKLMGILVVLLLAVFPVSADVITGPRLPSQPATLGYFGAIAVVVGVCAWFILHKIRR
jgi:hypothetical protein